MLRLVNRRGISAGFLSCLNFDLHFNFETGCVRNFVRTRKAIVGSDCEPGLIIYFVCMGAGEKRESIFSCVPYLNDRYYTASKKNFYKRNGFPYPDPSKKKLIFTECDYFWIRT
jgi:hypothetical protein